MSDAKPRPSISLASDFLFGQLRPDHKVIPPTAPPPPLGPLAFFVGDFVGNGFNTIFRPDSAATPTQLPNPVPPAPPPHDNVLELNLTSETLSFSKSLGSVPNRGTGTQQDAFLNGVPYVQSINDITIRGESVGIHFEPGIWIHVPATTVPPLGETVTRMASIPHGTTIDAQGLVDPAKPGRTHHRRRGHHANHQRDGTSRSGSPARQPLTPKLSESRRIWDRSSHGEPSLRRCWTIQTHC